MQPNEPIMRKYILGWFGLLVIAMINGALCGLVYKPFLVEKF